MKKLAFELAYPLSLVFEASWNLGEIPNMWKKAQVVPVFKKGSALSVANYRPISLTCVPCRVMESIIKDKMTDFLNENAIISEQQHGFLKKKSTVSQLLLALNEWTKHIDNRGNSIDIAYLDFAKAFVTVAHNMLLWILNEMGFRGHILNWIRAFLFDRTQVV